MLTQSLPSRTRVVGITFTALGSVAGTIQSLPRCLLLPCGAALTKLAGLIERPPAGSHGQSLPGAAALGCDGLTSTVCASSRRGGLILLHRLARTSHLGAGAVTDAVTVWSALAYGCGRGTAASTGLPSVGLTLAVAPGAGSGCPFGGVGASGPWLGPVTLPLMVEPGPICLGQGTSVALAYGSLDIGLGAEAFPTHERSSLRITFRWGFPLIGGCGCFCRLCESRKGSETRAYCDQTDGDVCFHDATSVVWGDSYPVLDRLIWISADIDIGLFISTTSRRTDRKSVV